LRACLNSFFLLSSNAAQQSLPFPKRKPSGSSIGLKKSFIIVGTGVGRIRFNGRPSALSSSKANSWLWNISVLF